MVAGDWVVLADTVSAAGGAGRAVSASRLQAVCSCEFATARCAVLTLRPDSGDADLAPGVVLQFDGSRLVTDGVLRLDMSAERFTLDGAFVLA